MRDVEPILGIVTLQIDAGPSRQLPERYVADHLQHGFALTGHAAQGVTVDRTFVLVRAEGAMAEWGYVAASRAQTETRLCAVGPEIEPEGARRLDPPWTRPLADALSRSAAERTAAEQAGVRRLAPFQPEIERLEIQLDSRAEQLRATEAELSRLGRFGGGPRHGELREAVSVQRHAVRELQAELRALARDDARVRPASAERAWSRAYEQPVRQAPSRGMGLGL